MNTSKYKIYLYGDQDNSWRKLQILKMSKQPIYIENQIFVYIYICNSILDSNAIIY